MHEDDGADEPDNRTLPEIARDDAESMYAQALDSGEVSKFEDDEDAPAYAICFIENAKGERGWAVVVGRGHSWEGLRIGVGGVFDSRRKAARYVSTRIAEDEEEYLERISEDDEGDEDDEE